MRFRHLSYRAGTPVAALGPAALDDLLDRGNLETWRELAQEIARDPWGVTADTVVRLCAAHPMYGTSALWSDWIARRRGQHLVAAEDHLVSLGQARVQVGLTQTEVGKRLGISQADVSKLERRRDVRLSTLRDYAHAIGARIEVLIHLPGKDRPDPLDIPALIRDGDNRKKRSQRMRTLIRRRL